MHLRRIGFHCMLSAPCLYTRGTGDSITVITVYIDDILVSSPSQKEVDGAKAEIMNKWGTEDNGAVKEFLGVKITQERAQRKISLDLKAYIKAMVNKWLDGANNKSWIPMQHVATTAEGSECTPTKAKQYQELVGQLLWVTNTVRPDISFAVGTLAHYMSRPTNGAWNAAIHVLKYLNHTSEYHLQLGGKPSKHISQSVVTYTDAN